MSQEFSVMGSSILFLLFSSILTTLPLPTAQQCLNPAVNFTTNSTYGLNRNRILSSLASTVTANGRFYTTCLAQGSDTIYALALCRGDLTNQSCFDCVDTASQSIIKNCPNTKDAVDFGASSHCIVRCSNQSFFSVLITQPYRTVYITSDITTNGDEFDQALSSLVDRLVTRVTTGSSIGKFATGETSYAAFGYIYGLVQCVHGLSLADCKACIESAVEFSRSSSRKTGVNIITPSCMFQYQLSNFYDSSAVAALPTPPLSPPPPPVTSPPPPSTNRTMKGDDNSSTIRITIVIVVPVSILLVLTAIASVFFRLRKREDANGSRAASLCKSNENIGVPILDLVTIAEATNNFSRSNKIGEGGFGPVLKGQLSTGQLIAVKRNSEKSNQGLREFKNEVTLIAKLQHRNLVRLLGCCIQGEERMLIYEYMPNGSLDSYIFDSISDSLTWSRRFDIIVGIARGLLYLHRDSRLRIVHRDLKASNILLDKEMNPKIADFGIARAFRGDQQLEKTGRVVGTYGYMSPEYVMDGLFSMKSDVYSFGVLVLEIVSGKRNREFYHPDHGLTLLGHAWKLWIEGKALELVPEQMEDFAIPETLKCIQVGLLCVQQHPEDRPTMPFVLLALDSESATLPQPKQPGFYTERSSNETEPPSSEKQSSTNEMTITVLSGR